MDMFFKPLVKSTILLTIITLFFISACTPRPQDLSTPVPPKVADIFKRLTRNGFAAVSTTDDQWKIVLPADYFFSAAKSTDFKPDSTDVLDQVAEVLQLAPYRYVYVFVYTDNVGSRIQKNFRSYWQAFNIASYLWAQDIPQSIRGYGKGAYPVVASNQTVQGSAYNRRIEIMATDEMLGGTVGLKGLGK